MRYEEVEGDLIAMAKDGHFDVIAHGCNCFSTMGAGIAPKMAKAFGCDSYPMEKRKNDSPVTRLGNIDWGLVDRAINPGRVLSFNSTYNEEHERSHNLLYVVNAYTQYSFGANHLDGVTKPLDYGALILCLKKINKIFAGKHIGLPQIGCGLAGGEWKVVRDLIFEYLTNVSVVTIVMYKPKSYDKSEEKSEVLSEGRSVNSQ